MLEIGGYAFGTEQWSRDTLVEGSEESMLDKVCVGGVLWETKEERDKVFCDALSVKDVSDDRDRRGVTYKF